MSSGIHLGQSNESVPSGMLLLYHSHGVQLHFAECLVALVSDGASTFVDEPVRDHRDSSSPP